MRLPQHLPGALAIRRRQRSASASRRARPCCGAAPISSSAGGIHALGAEIAEDAAATKVVRDAGRTCGSSTARSAQPLGYAAPRERCGTARCAGRAYAAHSFLTSSSRRRIGRLRRSRLRRCALRDAARRPSCCSRLRSAVELFLPALAGALSPSAHCCCATHCCRCCGSARCKATTSSGAAMKCRSSGFARMA